MKHRNSNDLIKPILYVSGIKLLKFVQTPLKVFFPENLTPSEIKSLKRLSKNKNIVIQKVDKGSTVVILDKCSYISAIEEVLNDNSKFSKLDIPAGKEINLIVNLEKRITSELKLLKDKEIIGKSTYKSIKPVGSRPGILYGSGKIHKEIRNGLSPFYPNLSAIDTPTYKLAKFLLKLLTPLTANEYTVISLCRRNLSTGFQLTHG